MKIAQYVETFSYVGMFNTMNFASYICLYLISPFMQHPVVGAFNQEKALVGAFSVIVQLHRLIDLRH